MLKINTKEQDVWFMSDPHYWHKNMTYGPSTWPNRDEVCRRFDTTQEMSQHIVKQINTYVKEDDTLFDLGDWSFGGIKNIWNFRRQLRCKNIHKILGNHDHHIAANKILPNVWHDDFNGNGIFVEEDTAVEVYAQDLFMSCQDYLEVEIDGILVCMMHYPIEEWNDRFKKSYHLFGHVHGRIPHESITTVPRGSSQKVRGGGRTDVGFDYAKKVLKEYRPFSWQDIKTLLK